MIMSSVPLFLLVVWLRYSSFTALWCQFSFSISLHVSLRSVIVSVVVVPYSAELNLSVMHAFYPVLLFAARIACAHATRFLLRAICLLHATRGSLSHRFQTGRRCCSTTYHHSRRPGNALAQEVTV